MTFSSNSIKHPQNAIHDQSIQDCEGFWMKASNSIHWHQKPSCAFGKSLRETDYVKKGQETWFPNGSTNTCFNCLDRHIYPPQHAASTPLTASPLTPHLSYNVEAANKIAFHHVSPLPFQKQQYRKVTYGEALEMTQTNDC
jgi:propionyl-CoA synthetase